MGLYGLAVFLILAGVVLVIAGYGIGGLLVVGGIILALAVALIGNRHVP